MKYPLKLIEWRDAFSSGPEGSGDLLASFINPLSVEFMWKD